MRLGEDVDVAHLKRGQLGEAQAGPDRAVEHVPHGLGSVGPDQLVLRVGQEDHLVVDLVAGIAARQPGGFARGCSRAAATHAERLPP